MPPSGIQSTQSRFRYLAGLIWVFDFGILALIGLWLSGGLSWNGHLYLRHGADARRVALILGLLGYFIFPVLREKSKVIWGTLFLGKVLQKPWFCGVAYLAVACSAMAIVTLQCLALRYPLWDVGIFHQILWSISHGLGFHSSISGAGDFLKDHLSPSLALLAPAFQLSKESPLFLPIAHACLLFLGGGAWIFLASRISGVTQSVRSHLMAATFVFFVSFDSIWKNLRWGFHENSISFACLSWAFALLFSSDGNPSGIFKKVTRTVFILLLFAIAAGSKEILLLDVAMALICWGWVEQRNSVRAKSNWAWARAVGLFVLAIGLFSIFIYFEKIVHPADKNYFNRYYSYLGNNLNEFFITLMRSPEIIVKTIGWSELLKYFWVVFSPWLFIPLFFRFGKRSHYSTKPWLWIVVILPSLASAALATYSPLRRPDFHYVLELWPVLACLTLLFLAKQRSTSLIWAWAFIGLLRMDYDPVGELRSYLKEQSKISTIRQKIQSIPSTQVVVADELAGPWIAGRQWVTRWPDTGILPSQCPHLVLVQHAERGTLIERGVQSLMTRCESGVSTPIRNADLKVPQALWREGSWSIYEVHFKEKVIEKSTKSKTKEKRHK